MLELGQRARLLQKAIKSPLVGPFAAGGRHHAGALAVGVAARKVLLDRKQLAEPAVLGEVGDAESAGSQNRFHDVGIDRRAGRQISVPRSSLVISVSSER